MSRHHRNIYKHNLLIIQTKISHAALYTYTVWKTVQCTDKVLSDLN